MKNPGKLFVLSAMLLLFFSASSAQERPWQVILYSGDTLTASRLDSLHDNVLSATWDSVAFSLPVDSIAALVQHNKGSFLMGGGIGSLVGAMAGAGIGAATYQKPTGLAIDLGPGAAAIAGGFAGAFCGFFVGGFIGESFSDSETYDLKGKSLGEKLQLIENLIVE